jgi:hypothetical protein
VQFEIRRPFYPRCPSIITQCLNLEISNLKIKVFCYSFVMEKLNEIPVLSELLNEWQKHFLEHFVPAFN